MIENYTLIEILGEESGTFQEKDREITYIYSKNKGKVIAHYVDIKGRMLGYDITLEGYIGEEYETPLRRFKGYSFVQVVGAYAGQYQKNLIEVTYIYQKNENPEKMNEVGTTDIEIQVPNTGVVENNNYEILYFLFLLLSISNGLIFKKNN